MLHMINSIEQLDAVPMSEAWQFVKKTYVENENYILHIWGGVPDAAGRYNVELACRRPRNSRRQGATIHKYAKIILRDGMMEAFRGRLLAVNDDGESGTAKLDQNNQLMGGAGIVGAAKVAKRMEPDNVNIKRLEKSGIAGCMRLKACTPDFVLDWLKAKHNSFHVGVGATLVEVLEVAVVIEDAWSSCCRNNRISSASCPTAGEFTFQNIYRRFVAQQIGGLDREGSGWFTNPYHYESAKKAYNFMTRIGVWSSVKLRMEKFADFTDRTFRKDVACHCMRDACVTMEQIEKGICDIDAWKVLSTELLKLCVQHVPGPASACPWLPKDPTTTQTLLSRLFKQMLDHADDVWVLTMIKKVSVLMSCLKKKDYESAQPLVMKSIAFALGEPKGSWKARWREIESAFVDLHGSAVNFNVPHWSNIMLNDPKAVTTMKGVIEHLAKKSAEQAVASLSEFDGKSEADAGVLQRDATVAEFFEGLNVLSRSQDAVLHSTLFLNPSNARVGSKFHPAFASLATSLGGKVSGTVQMEELFKITHESLRDVCPAKFMKFCGVVMAIVNHPEARKDLEYTKINLCGRSNGLFPDWDSALRASRLHWVYSLELLGAMMGGSFKVTEKDYGCVFEQLGKAAAPGSDLGDFLLNQSCKFYDVGQEAWVKFLCDMFGFIFQQHEAGGDLDVEGLKKLWDSVSAPSVAQGLQDPPPSEVLPEDAAMTITSIRNQWAPPSSDGSSTSVVGPNVLSFMMALGQYLYHAFICSATSTLSVDKVALFPDKNLSNIKVDMSLPAAQWKPTADDVSDTAVMNFAGKITRRQNDKIPSLHVCSAFGQYFFVEAGPFGSFDHDGFAPAWCIPEVKTSKKRKGQVDDDTAEGSKNKNTTSDQNQTPSMELHSTNFKFEHAWTNFPQTVLVQVDCKIHYLKFNSKYVGFAQVPVTRGAFPPSPVELKGRKLTLPAALMGPTPKAKAKATKGGSKGDQAFVKATKHLVK
ncbi:unnamed protein product [Prorocentrum cordatum]|uniref:Uncharacterized protein n=1 Tax=Prorocentrum cordatum TaxID=2364126 RepID=A0ABN9TGG5_9DINO|nr:unnamed protein product [Polarella glacialis]